jgi:hypothetical protein
MLRSSHVLLDGCRKSYLRRVKATAQAYIVIGLVGGDALHRSADKVTLLSRRIDSVWQQSVPFSG